MKPIAIVPARGGSKRIPRKNLQHFCGVPFVQRLVELLARCGVFERVLVSTDDIEIADAAERAGGWVPQLRDPSLAGDYVSTSSVVLDAMGWFRAAGTSEFDEVFVAYPTSVFLKENHILALAERFRSDDVEHVFLAAEIGVSVARSWVQRGSHWEPFDSDSYFRRSQDLPKSYADTGQGYWSTPMAWKKLAQNEIPKSGAVVVDRWEAIDIDTPEDLRLAELVWRATRES